MQAPALKNTIGIRLQGDADVINLPVQGAARSDRIVIQGGSVVHIPQRVPPSIPAITKASPQTRDIVARFPSALTCGEAATLELQVNAPTTVSSEQYSALMVCKHKGKPYERCLQHISSGAYFLVVNRCGPTGGEHVAEDVTRISGTGDLSFETPR